MGRPRRTPTFAQLVPEQEEREAEEQLRALILRNAGPRPEVEEVANDAAYQEARRAFVAEFNAEVRRLEAAGETAVEMVDVLRDLIREKHPAPPRRTPISQEDTDDA